MRARPTGASRSHPARGSYPSQGWRCGSYRLNTKKRPLIMGILNITPDSFSDGGRFFTVQQALKQAIWMEQDGADMIDIGGESTRPGATPVTTEEELRRVLPVIKLLIKKLSIPLSIDTIKAEVARQAVDVGVSIINDISGLTRDPEMITVASKSNAGLVIMHSKGNPQTMQKNPKYKNVLLEVYAFLERQIKYAIGHGISKNRIVIDPGIGFGKTVNHNLTLIKNLSYFIPLGVPILIGPSRKSFIRKVLNSTNQPFLEGTIEGTAAASAIAVFQGARILRVHDVAYMRMASQIADAVMKGKVSV